MVFYKHCKYKSKSASLYEWVTNCFDVAMYGSSVSLQKTIFVLTCEALVFLNLTGFGPVFC